MSSRIRPSAGTSWPARSRTTSPGTSCAAGMRPSCPSRRTSAVGTARRWSEVRIRSTRLSVAYPTAAFTATTPTITRASKMPPLSSETAAAPASRATGKVATWSTRMAIPDLGFGVGRLFGPYSARRCATSIADSPLSGATSSRAATASAAMACQDVRGATLERPRLRPRLTVAARGDHRHPTTANDLHDELVHGHPGGVEEDEYRAGDGIGACRCHEGERLQALEDARGEYGGSPELRDAHPEAAGYCRGQEGDGRRSRTRLGGHDPVSDLPGACDGSVDPILSAGKRRESDRVLLAASHGRGGAAGEAPLVEIAVHLPLELPTLRRR